MSALFDQTAETLLTAIRDSVHKECGGDHTLKLCESLKTLLLFCRDKTPPSQKPNENSPLNPQSSTLPVDASDAGNIAPEASGQSPPYQSQTQSTLPSNYEKLSSVPAPAPVEGNSIQHVRALLLRTVDQLRWDLFHPDGSLADGPGNQQFATLAVLQGQAWLQCEQQLGRFLTFLETDSLFAHPIRPELLEAR